MRVKTRFARLALRCCVLALFPTLVLAQDPGTTQDSQRSANGQPDNHTAQQDKQLGDLSLEELSNMQVYGASKHLQSTREAPASVTVITRDEIQRYGYRTLADILRNVRGLYITYDKFYSHLGVRGFGRPSDLNTRMLILVDGHRINDNVYDQGMIGTEFWVDVDLIERVEVILGPSSSLYGANAFFGIVNVISRKPEQVNGTELSFTPASAGTYGGRATIADSFHGVAGLLSATFYDNRGPATLDGFTNLPGNLDADSTRDFMVELSAHGFTLQAVSGYRYKATGEAFAFSGLPGDGRAYAEDQHHYGDLTYRHTFGDGWSLLNRSYYDHYLFKGAFPLSADSVSVSHGVGNWWGDELQASRTFMGKHQVTFGAELRDNLKQYQQSYSTNPVVLSAPSNLTSWDVGFYAQDEYDITHQWTVSAGMRFDRYGTLDGTVNPRVGLIYHPTEKSVFKLLYGSAFRPPNAFEIVGEDPSGPALQPETIKSIEGIWEQGLSEHYRVTLDVFHNDIRDLINSNGIFLFANLGSAGSTGAEFEFEGRFSSGLMGKLSYGYTDAANKVNDAILSNSPSHLVKLNLSVPLLKNALIASTDAQYEASRTTDAGDRVGGFPLCDFTLFTPPRHHWELSFSVYNLLDRNYSLPASSATGVIRQGGRSVRGKITWILGNSDKAGH
jgi:iron complex outermembrane receptor protein